jgi:hypothetical protein
MAAEAGRSSHTVPQRGVDLLLAVPSWRARGCPPSIMRRIILAAAIALGLLFSSWPRLRNRMWPVHGMCTRACGYVACAVRVERTACSAQEGPAACPALSAPPPLAAPMRARSREAQEDRPRAHGQAGRDGGQEVRLEGAGGAWLLCRPGTVQMRT